MPLFLANLAMASYFLALCYMLATVVTVTKYWEVRRVLRQHHHVGWSTVQLLVLSIALGCLFRTATFSTLCFFDSQNTELLPPNNGNNGGLVGHNGGFKYGWLNGADPDPDAASGSGDGDDNAQKELDFYNKVVAVLFNLPDFLFVSSYLLLVLVWAEAFQSSRRHWFSATEFRRRWMIFYLIFNGILYLMQLLLYAALFLLDKHGIFKDDKEDRLSLIPEMIFYVVAATDLFLPLIIFSTWFYLTLSLSGFPYKSQSARFRLKRVGRLAMAWSVGRILYSVMTLLTFTKGWFNVGRGSASVWLSPVFPYPVDAVSGSVYRSRADSDLPDAGLEAARDALGRELRAFARELRSVRLDRDPPGESYSYETVMWLSARANYRELIKYYAFCSVPQLQFHPSPVLVQLLQNDKRHNISAKSAKHQKQMTKNAKYLERKLESEIRQHYELENAQSCARWKKFHLQTSESQKELAQRIESEFQQLCKRLNVSCKPPLLTQDQDQVPTTPSSNQSRSLTLFSTQDEDESRLQLASDWIQQERFNIQEAFTNQTKKIQADFQSFLDQLDQEFESERTRILSLSFEPTKFNTVSSQHVNTTLPPTTLGQGNQQLEKQFKNNAKRHMLVHTAPVVDPHSHSQVSQLLHASHIINNNNNRRTDVSATQQQLDRLQARMETLKETAEAKRKEGMEWIGRQCARMLSQLDCKETEAKLAVLVQKQHQSDMKVLIKRINQLGRTIRDAKELQ